VPKIHWIKISGHDKYSISEPPISEHLTRAYFLNF
jgi:hypothetical protein